MGGNHQTNDNNNQIQSIQQPTYIYPPIWYYHLQYLKATSKPNSLSYQITDSAKKGNNLLKICYSMQLLHPVNPKVLTEKSYALIRIWGQSEHPNTVRVGVREIDLKKKQKKNPSFDVLELYRGSSEKSHIL